MTSTKAHFKGFFKYYEKYLVHFSRKFFRFPLFNVEYLDFSFRRTRSDPHSAITRTYVSTEMKKGNNFFDKM